MSYTSCDGNANYGGNEGTAEAPVVFEEADSYDSKDTPEDIEQAKKEIEQAKKDIDDMKKTIVRVINLLGKTADSVANLANSVNKSEVPNHIKTRVDKEVKEQLKETKEALLKDLEKTAATLERRYNTNARKANIVIERHVSHAKKSIKIEKSNLAKDPDFAREVAPIVTTEAIKVLSDPAQMEQLLGVMIGCLSTNDSLNRKIAKELLRLHKTVRVKYDDRRTFSPALVEEK